MPAPSPALGLPAGRAGPLRLPGMRGKTTESCLQVLPKDSELRVLQGAAWSGRPALGARAQACAQPAGRPRAAHWLTPPPPAVAWLAARRGCPLGAGQAGPRPAGPGGRRPRQWALVPGPQAPGQSLGPPAGSPRTLSTPRDQAPPGSPAAPTPPQETGASQVSTPSPLSPSSGLAPVDWVWAAGGGWLFDGAPPHPGPLSLAPKRALAEAQLGQDMGWPAFCRAGTEPAPPPSTFFQPGL